MQEVVQRIAATIADPGKMQEALLKLKDLKDNNIFKALETLAAPGTSLEAAQAASKDVLQRVGFRGAVGDAMKALCSRLCPTVLAPEHLTALLQLASSECSSGGGSAAYAAAVLGLLRAASGAGPQLFAQLAEPVAALLAEDDAMCAATAARYRRCCSHTMTCAIMGAASVCERG